METEADPYKKKQIYWLKYIDEESVDIGSYHRKEKRTVDAGKKIITDGGYPSERHVTLSVVIVIYIYIYMLVDICVIILGLK